MIYEKRVLEPILTGSVMGAFLIVVSGALIYYFWNNKHKDNSALWEINSVKVIAGLSLINSLTLPLLTLSPKNCIWVLSLMGLAFAILEWRQKAGVFAYFNLVAIFLAIFCVFIDYSANKFIITASAILWIISAYLLHYPLWKKEDKIANAKLGTIALILGIFFSIVFLAELFNFSVSASSSTLAVIIITGSLLAFASYKKWLRAITIINLSSLIIAYYLWDIGIRQWKNYNNLFIGFILLTLLTVIAIFALIQLSKLVKQSTNWTNLSHFLISLSYIFVCTKFLSYSHNNFKALIPLDTLIIPLVAWIYFSYSQNLGEYKNLYLNKISRILSAYTILWLVVVNLSKPTATAYLPILNTIELGSIAILWQLWNWQKIRQAQRPMDLGFIAILALIVLSASVMRVWHYYYNITWDAKTLLASFGVQASLSIIWAIAGISAMVLGNRQKLRPLWIAGATVMAIVVAKLFLVELANSNGIARIVSFIVVGLLLLFVGWFAPAPPKR